jgi:uncharacterized protein (TIGR02145 family)
MSENLNVDKFRNGDLIPEAKTDAEWKRAGENKQPAWCYYDNNPENGTKYGKLYNWYAVSDSRGLAPTGWHIPTNGEWTILSNFLGGIEIAGEKMKTDSGWTKNNNGTNASGFSGLPGGYHNEFGQFGNAGYWGYWWSNSEYETGLIGNLALGHGSIYRSESSKGSGISVRCVKD